MKKLLVIATALLFLSSCEVEYRGDTRYYHHHGWHHEYYPEHHDVYHHGWHHDERGAELEIHAR